ncbi:MATE family efflux transporter [Adhaeribacter radiodurans]|uniref:O-antigen translocase n=1 Tax=Adhaeribacter radiodurans TaxID=2745197 RepID=A0A7L7L5Y6_9BACT|nr:hypothetical protein [Adhaeribacter radiodurans]QMU27935.1 hypothetical protein HUW48_07705 [Adhaeribacter radiodurans]
MFTFLRNSILGVLSVGFRLVSSLLLNKVIASYFGPAGLAQLAHFQNLLSFFTLIPNDGINRGILPYLSQNESNSPASYRYLKSGFGLTCIVFGLSSIIILLGRNWFLTYLPFNLFWLTLFITGAFLVVAQSFFNAVLLARQRTGVVVVGNCLSALLVIVYVFVAYQKITLSSFLVGYLLTLSSIILFVLPFSWQGLSFSEFKQTRFSSLALKQLSRYIFMALSVLLFTKGLDYYIRDFMIRHFSIYQAGLWQGVVRLSDSYTALFTAVLSYAFYPKVSALCHDNAQLKVFVRNVLKLVIPVILVGLAGVYFARTFILTGLFSSNFLKAQDLLPFQLTGDLFKLCSWLLANILVAKARVWVIIFFEGISAVAYLGSFYFFTDHYGIAGSTMAHCANYFFFLILHVLYFRKLLFA